MENKMKKLTLAIVLSLILSLSPTKSEAHYYHPMAPVLMSSGTSISMLALTIVAAGFAVIPLNVYGVDPWHPLAKLAFGDKGVVVYSYPKGKNGA